ncbi:MAG TPA: sigma-54-dependent Fis family transcriptional regulator [Planctomycetota bacterium]|nr:sigma-54-dependent Fis family transcriptional regulator [Planctomycetota bacterium]
MRPVGDFMPPVADFVRPVADTTGPVEGSMRPVEPPTRRVEHLTLQVTFLDRYDPDTKRLGNLSKTAVLSLLQLERSLDEQPEDILRSLEDLLTVSIDLVGAKRGLLLLPDELEELKIHSERNFDRSVVSRADQWFSRTLARKAIETDSVYLVRDVGMDPIFKDVPSLQGLRVSTMLAAPIRADKKLLGILMFHDTVSGGEFLPKDGEIVVELAVRAALKIKEHEAKAERRRATASIVGAGKLLGKSKKMDELRADIAAAARSNLSIVLHGETGTGKELAAQALHELSPRRKGPFVTMNAAAVSEEVADSDLFGHTKGAFTDAKTARKGLFLKAHGGTLFLDEVAELSPRLQAKLLRVVEYGEVRPVGSDDAIKVDVRVICASHKDLDEEVAARRFRGDLAFRLRGLTIELPPLRERREDILFLFERFLEAEARKLERAIPTIPADVKRELESHSWPGNVRELLTAAQRAAAFAKGKIEPKHLQLRKMPEPPSVEEEVTPEQILAAIDKAGGNVSQAAAELGLSRAKVRRMREKHGT